MDAKKSTLEQCGKNLKNLRTHKKRTQEDLAGELNTSQSTISRIELGKDLPSQELLCRICEYFGILAKDFFGDALEAVLAQEANPGIDENCNMEEKIDYLIHKLDQIYELLKSIFS